MSFAEHRMLISREMKKVLALSISAVLHAAIFVTIAITPHKEKPKAPTIVELVETPLAPSLPESTHKTGTTKKTSNPKPKNFALNSQTSIKEKWLNHSEGDISTPQTDPTTELQPEAHGYSKAVQYGEAMTLEFTNNNLGFFEALHAKINHQLVYPEDFVKARFTGNIHIEAELNNKGQIKEFRAINADNDVLTAYALAFLTQVLKEPLAEKKWLTTDNAIVSFDFEFKTRIENNPPTDSHEGTEKNHLYFAREGLVDPWINEKITEVFTHYVPPIIPFVGGVYVDFVLAYQYVKNISTNAPLESEVRLARIKNIHKNLLQTIRQGREPKATPQQAEPPSKSET